MAEHATISACQDVFGGDFLESFTLFFHAECAGAGSNPICLAPNFAMLLLGVFPMSLCGQVLEEVCPDGAVGVFLEESLFHDSEDVFALFVVVVGVLFSNYYSTPSHCCGLHGVS